MSILNYRNATRQPTHLVLAPMAQPNSNISNLQMDITILIFSISTHSSTPAPQIIFLITY